MQPIRASALLAIAAIAPVASAATAQEAPRIIPGITPTPAPQATAVPIPPPPVVVLPTPTPTPVASPTAAAPVAQPEAATPRPPVTEPTAAVPPRSEPSRAIAPTPAPTVEPSTTAPSTVSGRTESAEPTSAAVPPGEPSRAPAPEPDVRDQLWPWLLGLAALLALAAIGWWLMRRRALLPVDEEPVEPVDVPEPVASVAPATPVAAGRAHLTLELRPTRAGLNMLSATVECELTMTNTGGEAAEDARLGVSLLSAHAGQDAELVELRAAPVARPMVPPFTLLPGESRTARVVAALPRGAIRTMTAGGRPMFVPLVAVNLLYRTAGREAQVAQAFAIGVERVDSAKLGPFWLDGPPRTFDTVAARPHTVAIER